MMYIVVVVHTDGQTTRLQFGCYDMADRIARRINDGIGQNNWILHVTEPLERHRRLDRSKAERERADAILAAVVEGELGRM